MISALLSGNTRHESVCNHGALGSKTGALGRSLLGDSGAGMLLGGLPSSSFTGPPGTSPDTQLSRRARGGGDTSPGLPSALLLTREEAGEAGSSAGAGD